MLVSLEEVITQLHMVSTVMASNSTKRQKEARRTDDTIVTRLVLVGPLFHFRPED